MAMNLITQERLKSLLTYDPDSGEFRWRVKRPRCVLGAKAGTFSYHNYTVIKLDGVSYKAHRLAWLYVYGDWPSGGIDHINRHRSDNRISNLREATHFDNCQNRSKALAAHSRHVGVSKNYGYKGWRAYIDKDNKRVCLGSFADEAAAVAARKAAERHMYATTDLHRVRRNGTDGAAVVAQPEG